MFYRLRQTFHNARFKYATNVLASGPMRCDPKASCAIHTMLSARDTPLYLAAIKSFLRYYPDVAVVIHSDGTLRNADNELLNRHIPGCTLISAEAADGRRTRRTGS